MANITINLVGLDKALSDIKKYVRKTHDGLTGAVAHSTNNIKSNAKTLVPVDTGRLKSEITELLKTKGSRLKGSIEGEVISDTPYAVYVEFGTSKMRAQPYMDPAYRNEKDNFINAVTKVLQAP